MDLDDDSLDGAVSRWGCMLMADPAAALRETRLRDGGRLAFAIWQTPDRNPWAALPGMTLVQRGHMPPPERRYSAEDLWDALLNQLPETERDETRAAIEDSMEQVRQGDELVVPAACWKVTAR
jgi:hypothetical protein